MSSITLGCASSGSSEAGSSQESSGGRSDCILQSSIRGYTVLDESNLVIEGSGKRKYHTVLQRPARGIRSSWGIAFDRHSSSRVCARFSEVLFRGHMDGESIRILSIRELSPEEHEALLIDFGRKKPEIEQTPAPAKVKGAEVEELDPAATDELSGN